MVAHAVHTDAIIVVAADKSRLLIARPRTPHRMRLPPPERLRCVLFSWLQHNWSMVSSNRSHGHATTNRTRHTNWITWPHRLYHCRAVCAVLYGLEGLHMQPPCTLANNTACSTRLPWTVHYMIMGSVTPIPHSFPLSHERLSLSGHCHQQRSCTDRVDLTSKGRRGKRGTISGKPSMRPCAPLPPAGCCGSRYQGRSRLAGGGGAAPSRGAWRGLRPTQPPSCPSVTRGGSTSQTSTSTSQTSSTHTRPGRLCCTPLSVPEMHACMNCYCSSAPAQGEDP